MEKERKITAPEGCEIEKVEIVDGAAVVTFKEKERKLPKSWEEFCEVGSSKGTYTFDTHGKILSGERPSGKIYADIDKTLLPDRATAEAVLALCQLIQLRNAYNGDWAPDWNNVFEMKNCVFFEKKNICSSAVFGCPELLYFKNAELRDEFLKYFRPLIEKLKPLYGIKEEGEEGGEE